MNPLRVLLISKDEELSADLESKIFELGATLTRSVPKPEGLPSDAGSLKEEVVMLDCDGYEAPILGDLVDQINLHWGMPVIGLSSKFESPEIQHYFGEIPFACIQRPPHLKDLKSSLEIARFRNKVAEQQISLQDRYRTFIDSQNEFVFHCQVDGTITYANPSFAGFLGFNDDQLIGKRIFDLIPQEDQNAYRDHFDEFLREGRSSNPIQSYEQRLKTNNGNFFYIHRSDHLVCDRDGKIIDIQTIARDITDRKLVENQLAQQLRESQALLQINQMLVGSIELSANLQQIVEAAANLIDTSDRAVVHLLDETGNILHAVAAAGSDQFPITKGSNFKAGEGIAGIVLATGETIILADAPADPRYVFPKDESPESSRVRSLLVAPVKASHKSLGTLSVHSARCGVFTQNDARLLTTLGTQVALALEKEDLLKTEREQRYLAETLRENSLALTTTLDSVTVHERILEQVRGIVPYDAANIILVQDGLAHPVKMVGYEQFEPEFSQEFYELTFDLTQVPCLFRLAESGKAYLLPDVEDSPEWRSFQFGPQIKSWIGAPLLAQGQMAALISLGKCEPGFYQPDHIQPLEAFAWQSALALQNAQLFESTQQRLKEVNALYKITQGITETFETDTILHQVVNLTQDYFGFYHVQIFLLDDTETNLVMRQGSGEIGAKLKHSTFTTPIDAGILGQVMLTGNPFVSNSVKEVPFYVPNAFLPETWAEMAVPMWIGEKIVGILDIHHRPPIKFVDHDLRLMTTIANQVAVVLEKVKLYNDLQAALLHEKSARAQLVQSEKLAALGRIVASVAHELNNPLQAIQNALYLVKLEELPNPQTHEDLEVALSEANRMAELIARLRETYRPTTREEFQPNSINALVIEVERLISTHLRHNNITMRFEPDPNLPAISIIRDQIKQVILNISLNAVESMRNGGTITVRTQNYPKEKKVSLSISDNGPGIRSDILPYIFDPFVTTKEGGTGLGLAITYDIVHRHNGHIEVDSVPDQITTFRVWLPAEQ